MLHAVLVVALFAQPGHLAENPVYRQLREAGLSQDPALKFAAPSMPDGLTAQEQNKVLEDLVGRGLSVDQFVRKSVVAPHILRMDDVETADKKPVKQVDVWFVVHGKLDAIANQDFLGENLSVESGQGKTLSAAELAQRNINIAEADKKNDSYSYLSYELLKKVQVEATTHTFWTRTAESVVVALAVDPRFAQDPEFPNQWRPLSLENGKLVPGEVQTYRNGGMYMKITQLKQPAGALFVESHILFSEPQGWFGGINLLGSKLPPIVTSQVRSSRREIMRASK